MRFLLLLSMVILASCGVRSTAGGPGSPSLVKVFSRPDGSTMYFAGPLHYRQVEGKVELEIDYTVVDNTDTVVCNFTLIATEQLDMPPNKITFEGDGGAIASSEKFEEFFREKQKKYRYRYSTTILRSEWLVFMKQGAQGIEINSLVFKGGKRHAKNHQMIKDQIIFSIDR